MARKNSEVNPLVKQLIEENKIKSANDAQDFMKNMFKDMVNILMQAEFDESIGYDKYDRESSANTTNTRNGYNSKQVNTVTDIIDWFFLNFGDANFAINIIFSLINQILLGHTFAFSILLVYLLFPLIIHLYIHI